MELHDYVQVARGYWWLLLAGLLLGAGFGMYQADQAPREFRGAVTFFVRTAGEGTTSAANLGDQFAQRRVNTYLALLRTDSTRTALKDAGVEIVQDGSTARIGGSADLDTVLLTATVTSPSREQALEVATALAETFPKLVDEVENADPGSAGEVQLVLVSGPSVRAVPTRGGLTVAVFAVLGVAVAAVLAVVLWLYDRKIRSLDQLRLVSGAALLGAIPFDRTATRSPVVKREASQSARAETFRELRTNLKFLDFEERAQTMVITSAVGGEGKTTTAANLATTMAQSGAKVLLIEADLRRPTFANLFDLTLGPGLVDVLRKSTRFEAALRELDTGVTILPSGTTAADAAELLDSVEMDRVLDAAEARFDFIILDAPPLLAVTDAVVLSVRCDGVILVVRMDSTTTTQVKRSMSALKLVDAPLLGVVASMIPRREHSPYGYEQASYTSTDGQWPVDRAGRS